MTTCDDATACEPLEQTPVSMTDFIDHKSEYLRCRRILPTTKEISAPITDFADYNTKHLR
jgi:hypothetical protein